MRQFYLYRNSSGYYNAVFVEPINGKKGTDKSTHKKDQIEAATIATTKLRCSYTRQVRYTLSLWRRKKSSKQDLRHCKFSRTD